MLFCMDDVARVREKTDLVSLIGDYIPLKKAGRNFKALCPFHGEKTPSFVISPERQIWHCFGCQKGGDCFTFLMEYEHLEFPESLEALAKRAGVPLSDFGKFHTATNSKKDLFYKLNHLAAEYYHYVLTKHPVGKNALSYLTKERGVNPQIVDTFMLGFAPRVGNALTRYFVGKKKYNPSDLLEAGLSVRRGSMFFDFFHSRIMFPLYDHRGNVLGFSGRILDESERMAKYVNTKDTLVYHKGSTFFGLNVTKDAIKKADHAILMEGEFDVLSAFQEGITNVVAVKGTALTENQVQLLTRFTNQVSLCFDQDAAGIEALKRSIPLLEKKGATITVIVTKGKDPDVEIREDPYQFKKEAKEAAHAYDFLLSHTLSRIGNETIEKKKRIADVLLPFFGKIENEIVKEHYLRKLADSLETTYERIIRQLEKAQPTDMVAKITQQVERKRERRELLEEYLLALILQSSSVRESAQKSAAILGENMGKDRASQKILGLLFSSIRVRGSFSQEAFVKELPKELVDTFDRCFLLPLPKFPDEEYYMREIVKVVKELKKVRIKAKMKTISEEIKKKESSEKNEDEVQELHKAFSTLATELKEM